MAKKKPSDLDILAARITEAQSVAAISEIVVSLDKGERRALAGAINDRIAELTRATIAAKRRR